MAVCRTAECDSAFIWVYVRLYTGGGAFDTMLSVKTLIKAKWNVGGMDEVPQWVQLKNERPT